MSNRYKGGFISGTPPTTSGTPYTGSAGGMWTASQVFQAKASGLWPVAGPSAPTSLSVVPFNASATVTFSGATVTAGKPAITSYTVTAFPGGRFVTGAASPLTVTGLTNDVLHTFTVSATNSDGTSIPSSGITETPMLFLPTAPTAISGVGQDGQVAVIFSGATVASGKPAITSYTVTVSPGGATVTGADSPLTVTGLTNGDQYTFTVVATNADGNSPASITSAAVSPSSYTAKLFMWGNNDNGVLGLGDTIHRSSPVQVGTGTNWADVSKSVAAHTIATKIDGTLWLWGLNNYGQLGLGDNTGRNSPVQVGALSNWSKMSAGVMHTAIIKTNGTLWTTGRGNNGGLGLGDTADRNTLAQVTGSGWSTVAAGYNCTLATKTDGTLWSWGYNGNGGLGQGDLIERMTPTQIGVGTNWSKVAIGWQHSIALKTDGTLWSWGHNGPGQLGQNNTVYRTLEPGQIGALTTWADVTAGGGFGLATKTDGTLWSWGNNGDGQLGDGTVINRSSPVQLGALTTWSKIAGADQHSIATKTDGTLWTWGQNGSGQLGQGNIINRSSPVQIGASAAWMTVSVQGSDIPAAAVISSVEQTDTGKVTVSFTTPKLAGITTTWTATSSPGGLTASNTTGAPITVTGLSSGVPYTFTVRGATAEGLAPNSTASSSVTLSPTYIGRLWSWGINGNGQLGDGTTINRSSPVQVGTGTNWAGVSKSGRPHTIATQTDGTLWAWGYNVFGQLGQGDTTTKSSPVQVGALSNWSKMSAGHMHTAIIKTDGTLWTTGRGIDGGLGLGDTADRSLLAQVTGSAWSTVAAGNNCTLATKTDGTLWSWGLNNYGQLGQGDQSARMTPTQIGVETNWSKVAIGNQHSMAIKKDGTLWSWGDNDVGVLGQNSAVARILQPGQIGALTTWADVIAGIGFGLATKTDGTLWSWGGNAYGELGYGDRTYTQSPVQVGALTTWSKIDGWEGVVATKTDGTLWSVGKNNNGQLGDGTTIARSSPVQVGTLTNWKSPYISGPAAGVTPTGVTVETIDTTATISYTPGA